jgi:iron complex transport system substrate-binding protein
MKICSFLPSATEILYALGLGDSLVGVTFECDFPPEARAKRVVVRSRLSGSQDAAEIDREVGEFVARGESLYEVDQAALEEAGPDLIITQELCHVCAATPGDLASSLALLPCPPQVLSLNAQTLVGVWNDIRNIGTATGQGGQAEQIVRDLERRLADVEQAVAESANRPRVVCLEWLDPPFVAGHWVPEMVALAGGIDALGEPGEAGFRTTWDDVLNVEPEVILMMPCGYHLDSVIEELEKMPLPQGWNAVPAVRDGRVFAVDASSYFSRPGPRLTTGVEILASVLHPDHAPMKPPAASLKRWESNNLPRPQGF